MSQKELTDLFDSTGQALSKMPDEIRPSTNGAIFNERGEALLQKRREAFEVKQAETRRDKAGS